MHLTVASGRVPLPIASLDDTTRLEVLITSAPEEIGVRTSLDLPVTYRENGVHLGPRLLQTGRHVAQVVADDDVLRMPNTTLVVTFLTDDPTGMRAAILQGGALITALTFAWLGWALTPGRRRVRRAAG